MDDIIDVHPVEEVEVVADLEGRLTGVENLDDTWDSLSITWSVASC